MRAWMLLLACIFNTAQAEGVCELPSCGGIPARTFTAKVIVVLDGDTVLVLRGSQQVKIRLAEIDAPEVGHAGMGGQPPNSQKGQEYGMESRQSLVEMVLRKQVQIDGQATDQYGRMVAQIVVGVLKVNEEQVRRGMAWAAVGWRQSRRTPTGAPLAEEYSYLHSDRHYIALQREAQQAHRGIWAQSNPIPPWEWRKQHPSTLPAPSDAAAVRTTAISLAPTCGEKKYCSEMSSCEEAMHYFTGCGVKALDGNRNGVPCEKLCAPQKK